MSTAQCLAGRSDRDEYVPMNSANGKRLFELASDTGMPLSIHFEMEDALLPELEQMLGDYPNANVIIAHFGQLRHPEKQTQFSAQFVATLLDDYPNLYFDISTGSPNRTYPCNNDILDTVIWQDDGAGGQNGTLKSEYLELMENYSDRFVAAVDYGSNRSALSNHYTRRVANIEHILRDLSEEAKQNISYKNAWKLITGKEW
jgi:predicted TIM-barrel fold metal-dependent hydrolase